MVDAAHPPLTLRRLAPALLALAVGAGATAALCAAVREREREQNQREFERAADDLEVPLRTRIDAKLDVLASIGRFYAGSKSVEADEFAQFTAPTFASHPGLKALAWLPRVGPEALAEHVTQAEAQYHLPPGYEVRSPDGRVRAGPPPGGDSFPVQYVAPFERRRGLWGLDLGSDPACRAAMEAARDGATAIAALPPALGEAAEDLGYFV